MTVIDIDNFKSFNDTYGHQAGDHVLKTLGNIILNCARRGVDWAFRHGGDEFAILIAQTTKEQALHVNERIAASYKEYNFGDTSLSFGLAAFCRNENLDWHDDINNFIKKADQAMYRAKSGGKDKIIIAD